MDFWCVHEHVQCQGHTRTPGFEDLCGCCETPLTFPLAGLASLAAYSSEQEGFHREINNFRGKRGAFVANRFVECSVYPSVLRKETPRTPSGVENAARHGGIALPRDAQRDDPPDSFVTALPSMRQCTCSFGKRINRYL